MLLQICSASRWVGASCDSPSAMSKRVEQPPIQPALRDREHHDFWPGFICSLIGLLVLFCGTRHLTAVDTTDGNSAWEHQLIKAFSSGGIQYVDRTARPAHRDPFAPPGQFAPPPPPELTGDQETTGPRWKIKVNLGANTPCPT
jgi:hypothetical protein